MTFILVDVEALREAQARYTEAIISMIGMREDLHEASRMAWGSEGDFCERVMAIEAKAAAQLQRIENDAVAARDYLQRKADEFERADREAEEAMAKLAERAGGLPLVPAWLWSGDPPPGYLADYWNALPAEDKLAIEQDRQRQLERWIAQLIAEGRLATATLEEFEDKMRGVQKVWASTPVNVRASPGADALRIGGLLPYQVAEWTMGVAYVEDGSKWYEVSFHDKDGNTVKGWVSAKYLEDYAYVRSEFDPNVEGSKHPFDLSNPGAYVPKDPEIAKAVGAGSHPQDLNLTDYFAEKDLTLRTEMPYAHHANLCGAFAVGAATGHDVKDVLSTWLEQDPKSATYILEHDAQVGRSDLEQMLDGYGIAHERQDGWMSPTAMQEQISQGRQLIALVGATSSTGDLNPNGVGHFVVVEEVMPAGNDGWVRLSNSLINQDPEAFDPDQGPRIDTVVRWSDFVSAWLDPGRYNPGTDFAGIWVDTPVSP